MSIVSSLIGCLIALKIVGLANDITWGSLIGLVCIWLIINIIFAGIGFAVKKICS